MFLHLWCLGLRASEVCTLKGNAYYQQGEDYWIQVYQVKMKNYKRIPIPQALYQIMKVYLKKHEIQPEEFIFKNSRVLLNIHRKSSVIQNTYLLMKKNLIARCSIWL